MAFQTAMEGGAEFSFHLEDFVPPEKTPKETVEAAVEAGKHGPIYGNLTNWELYTLAQYGKLGDVTFIEGVDTVVSNPFGR